MTIKAQWITQHMTKASVLHTSQEEEFSNDSEEDERQTVCNQSHSNLSHCVDFRYIGIIHHCMHTAGMICEDMAMSVTTKQVPTTIIYVTTANVSHDSTYKSHDTHPQLL